jgi:hypothetical protein
LATLAAPVVLQIGAADVEMTAVFRDSCVIELLAHEESNNVQAAAKKIECRMKYPPMRILRTDRAKRQVPKRSEVQTGHSPLITPRLSTFRPYRRHLRALVSADTNPKAPAMVQNLPAALEPFGTPLAAPHSHRGEAPACAVTPLGGSRQ